MNFVLQTTKAQGLGTRLGELCVGVPGTLEKQKQQRFCLNKVLNIV